jgi:Ca-activated chloride channel family protein
MFRSLIFSIVAASILAAVVVPAAQEPVFRSSSDVVRVFTTVTDKDGRLVTTLTKEAFEVRDEGKPQPIALFDNTPQPVRLIELLDVSGSMAGNLPLLRAASDELFARFRPDDVARVGSFGRDVVISPEFTKNVEELRRAVPRSIDPDAPTPLWRAVDSAMDAFNDKSEAAARPVILVLSDGKDSGPISWTTHVASQAEVIDRARKENVMIYAVAMRSRTGRPLPPAYGPGGLQAMLAADLPDPGLARVAEETGGGYIEIRLGEDLGSAFAGVADELHSQYLLGFAPPKRDGKTHEIEVRVSVRGVKPRARKSYVAPKQ